MESIFQKMEISEKPDDYNIWAYCKNEFMPTDVIEIDIDYMSYDLNFDLSKHFAQEKDFAEEPAPFNPSPKADGKH